MSKYVWIGLAALFSLTFSTGAFAEDFALRIGSSVAAQSTQAKSAMFVVGAENCADPATVKVTGTAEGLVQGARRSVPLKRVAPMPTPGVFGVFREWPVEGTWVVNLTGHCGKAAASVVVAVGANSLSRELSTFYSRPATQAEVLAVLKSMPGTVP